MALELLNGDIQPLDRTWRVVVASKDGTGTLASDSIGVTVSLRDLATSKWWNPDPGVWQLVQVNIDLAEDADVSGVYSVVVDAEAASGGAEKDALVVMNAADSDSAVALVALRHSLVSQAIPEVTLTAAPTTFGEALAVLAASLGGNAIVDDAENQLVLYQADGVTEIMRFGLKDAAGNPTSMEPFSRTVVP